MTIDIVPYDKKYAKSFYDLNIEWLKSYFYVEPYDEIVLKNPEDFIIDKGGIIFFAIQNSKVVGTVALMAFDRNGTYELTKMAVSTQYRGQKIGQKLMQYCIEFSRNKGIDKLVLYSNTRLKNAIYIYKKYGFKEVFLEPDSPYKRSNIKMELYL